MAPDAAGRDFIDFYLDAMKTAEGTAGPRLIDVLDLHWYPEATGDGQRVIDDGVTPGEVDARLQAPRSLWDPSYTETSWIAQTSTLGPIALVPRMVQKIAAHYPGTRLSFSEYYYGAGADISGGLAEADVLGVFGREGVFAAASAPLSDAPTPFLFAGFAMYRNYDGKGGTFGDTSIAAVDSATDQTSSYASVASSDPTNVIVVLVNKKSTALTAGITIRHTAHLAGADAFVLTSAAAAPTAASPLTQVATNAFSYAMPARSATTLVFHP
jgi:hypothetical protein